MALHSTRDKIMRRRAFLAAAGILVVMLATALGQPPTSADAYRSPYSVKFTHPLRELIGDLESGARGRVQDEAAVPFHEWYARHNEKKFGVWGPAARHYP